MCVCAHNGMGQLSPPPTPPHQRLVAARRIIIAACGTSFHSALVGEYVIETLARTPVEVEYASEFRYKNPILFPTGKGEGDVLIVISQSGEG